MQYVLRHTATHHPHLLTTMLHAFEHALERTFNQRRRTRLYGKLLFFRLWLSSRSKLWWAATFATTIALPMVVGTGLFITPRTVSYSFAGDNCVFNPVPFPGSVSHGANDAIKTYSPTSLSVFGTPILSTQTCVEVQSPDAPAQSTLAVSAGPLTKQITVDIPSQPLLALNTNIEQKISPADDIVFTLDQADSTYSYYLTVDEQRSDCTVQGLQVTCPLNAFSLTQGSTHDLQLMRSLGGQSSTVSTISVSLRDPVTIAASSIQPDQIVYDNPDTITFTANKPIASIAQTRLISGETEIPTSQSVDGNSITLTLEQPLQRQSSFTLNIEEALAEDGAHLPEPYTLTFSTSGGPQVTSVNIGSYDVSPTANVILDFDYDIAEDVGSHVTLTAAGSTVQAVYSVSGNRLTINPTASLGSCTPFTVSVADTLPNVHGVVGGSVWSTSSRTTCKQVFSIGSSVQGRSIIAHRFGSGTSNRVLYVGGTHGNEGSSITTLYSWSDYLERNYSDIPAGTSIVVIPLLNPDGYAVGTRVNANGVDLNRNFPSNDWSSGVYMPGGVYNETAGGGAPLDQPESAAIASYIDSFSPHVALTYHAVAAAVISNSSGNSHALTVDYAQTVGFGAYTAAQEDSLFSYPTTGEFETWLHDKRSIPTLLVELATLYGNEFSTQRPAMWALVQ